MLFHNLRFQPADQFQQVVVFRLRHFEFIERGRQVGGHGIKLGRRNLHSLMCGFQILSVIFLRTTGSHAEILCDIVLQRRHIFSRGLPLLWRALTCEIHFRVFGGAVDKIADNGSNRFIASQTIIKRFRGSVGRGS